MRTTRGKSSGGALDDQKKFSEDDSRQGGEQASEQRGELLESMEGKEYGDELGDTPDYVPAGGLRPEDGRPQRPTLLQERDRTTTPGSRARTPGKPHTSREPGDMKKPVYLVGRFFGNV